MNGKTFGQTVAKRFSFDKILSPSKLRAYFAEFIGMFFFLLTTIGTVCSATHFNELNQNQQGATQPFGQAGVLTIALGFGVTIMVLVYVTGCISGGHLNPAVTVGLMLYGRCNFWQGLIYQICQYTGALCGCAMVRGIWPELAWKECQLGLNVYKTATGMTAGKAFGAELWGTALLTFVVYGVAVHKRAAQNKGSAPLAIGFTVFLAHILLIGVTGCGINPARSLASAVVYGDCSQLWVYIVGAYVGGIVGASLHFLPFQWMNDPDVIKEDIAVEQDKTGLSNMTSVRDQQNHIPQSGQNVRHRSASAMNSTTTKQNEYLDAHSDSNVLC